MTQHAPPFHTTLQSQLAAQLDTHQQVNQALRDLRTAVISGKTDDIQRINQQLLAMGTTLAHMETERHQRMASSGFASMPLRELILQLPMEAQPQLHELRAKLQATIYQVQQEQEQTQTLLEHSTKWVRQTLGMIAQQVAPPSQSYGPNLPRKHATTPNASMLSQEQNPANGLPGGMTSSIIERTA